MLYPGGSAVYRPLGDVVGGPLRDEPGMLLTELDTAEIAPGRFDFDVTGHYVRPDIFRPIGRERTQHSVECEDHEGSRGTTRTTRDHEER